MPLSRGSEVPQKPSPTPRGPRHLRTSSSDSDPPHPRPLTEKSPKLVDRRSPSGSQSDPLHQKKLGTRITGLETQLVQAQQELKSLKQQLASTESAKKQAQEEVHKKPIKKPIATRKVAGRVRTPGAKEIQETNSRDKPGDEVPEDIHRETDVFEVPVEKMLVKSKSDLTQYSSIDDGKETNLQDSVISQQENPGLGDELASKTEEINQWRDKMEEKEREIQAIIEENEKLKQQLDEAKLQLISANGKEEEMVSKMNQLEKDLEGSKANNGVLKEKLLDVQVEKESLESEMKKMKVQTEQWRKAADEAAAVLAGGGDVNGRISDRCASMDKHFNGGFEAPVINGYGGYLGSPMAGDDINDDGFGGGKKKGSGIRMLGDLWKKKGQK